MRPVLVLATALSFAALTLIQACSEAPGDWVVSKHDNGTVKSEGYRKFESRQKVGHWTYWYKNGQKLEEGDYKDGLKQGISTAWYENGKRQSEGKYEDSQKIGLWTYWHDNGQIMTYGTYNDSGVVGGWMVYDRKGQLQWTTPSSSRSRPSWVVQHFLRSDIKKAEGLVYDGFKEGPWTYWYKNGQKREECNLDLDVLHGPNTTWYENGQKQSEGDYDDGRKNGRWTFWTDFGHVDNKLSGVYELGLLRR